MLSRHPGVSESLVGERVRARLARQGVLDAGVALWALIDELVLSREIGGPEIFRDALAHLARMARRPNVTVQIIPKGDYHVGLQGSVSIAEKSGALPSAFIEEFTDGRTVDDPATLNAVITRYRHLQALALPASSSLEVIDKAARQHD